MARSRDMQDALDIVAGRKQAAPRSKSAWGALECFGAVLWIGVGLMIIGLASVYVLS